MSAYARRNGLEDRVKMLHSGIRPTDHQAVAALQPPNSAAGTDVHVIDSLREQLLRPADVVNVVRVAAVDQNVASLEERHDLGDRRVHHRGRNHQPDRARLRQLADKIFDGRRARGTVFYQVVHRLGRHVEHRTGVSVFHQPPHHVGAHSSQTNHSKLHELRSPCCLKLLSCLLPRTIAVNLVVSRAVVMK